MTLAGFSLHITRYGAQRRQPPHAHDELHLSVVLHGSVEETIGGRTVTLRPMSIASKDPGVVHANAWGPRGAVLARLSITKLGLRDVAGDHGPEQLWAHDVETAAPFLRLVRGARSANGAVASSDANLADLLAALTMPRHMAAQGEPPAWLREAMALVRDGWYPGLSVADVAQHAGVHPVYLARCVRRWYRSSMGEELRRARLRHAVCTLAEESCSVSSIAHATGFADEPHLCRTLRASAELTPRTLRRIIGRVTELAQPARG